MATLLVLAIAVWVFVSGRRTPASAIATTPVASLGDSTMIRVEARDVKGRVIGLFDPASAWPQLVFVFRSDCSVCKREKADWEALAVDARAAGVQTVAVTGEALDSDLGKYYGAAPVTVLRLSDEAALPQAFHTEYVPTTLLVSREQRIRFHHIGLMTSDNLQQLHALMSAK